MKPLSPGAPGMTEHVNHDNGNLPSIALALLINLIAPWAAWFPVLPEHLVRNISFVVTGIIVFVANKALGKWMDRRWPDRKVRRRGDSQDSGD